MISGVVPHNFFLVYKIQMSLLFPFYLHAGRHNYKSIDKGKEEERNRTIVDLFYTCLIQTRVTVMCEMGEIGTNIMLKL